ncbi:MAG: 16S rRNA (cytosine(1402)-N(4))-methyltransferase RsmH [Clostridiales bacterium]|nr:16S rRNA (cytosine(1402)-N(4))-methyltransferase RsmH [Clostridiales bacterium]
MEFSHIPVLKESTIELLNIREGLTYVDGTIGGGGHSKAMLEKANIKLLVGIDQDTEALEAAKKNLESFKNVKFVNNNFKNIDEVFEELGLDKVDGILVDIGVSSYQIDNGERGFSFKQDAKLDMRMSRANPFSAYELVNTYSEEDLTRVIRDYGEEKFAKSIARHIVKQREQQPIETTKQLEEIILSSVPRYRGQDGRSNVQRTFQAIRIEVNGELDALKEFIDKAVNLLNPNGRLAIISFHSLEDRIVKQKFRELSTGCICPPDFPICVCGHKPVVRLITKHPVEATKEEISYNSRSAPAKLRVVEKI